MGILERLRPLPRWKHADPLVRASAVFELGADDADTLLALAREDSDARVRRAAVGRLDSVSALGEVARTDPDEDVRTEAVRMLAGLAAETSDASQGLAAVSALGDLGRQRELVAVGRDSALAEVRLAVTQRVTDAKSLGALARHAGDPAARAAALSSVTDAEELLNVALKSEHSDSAVAALERLEDEEAIGAVAQRARSKVASRRARTRLKSVQAAAAPPVVEVPKMAASDVAKAESLIARVEGLLAGADATDTQAALAAVRLEWAEFNADVEIEPHLTERFEQECEGVREVIAERAKEQAAADERVRALSREQADRVAICEAIETLTGPDAEDRVAELKVRWDHLPAMPSEYAGSLTRRFQDACRAFEDRVRRARLIESAGTRLESLATEAEQALAAEGSLESVMSRWRSIRRDADVLADFAHTNPAAAERLERAVAAFEEKEREQQAQREREQTEHLRRLQQLCRQLEALAAAESFSLKAGEKALRDIKAALEDRAPLPTKQDRSDIQRKLEAARAVLGPRVQELRDADEWQRWANVQVQETLCTEMEALKSEEKLDTAARRMRELQARWKEVSLAPRAQGEALWKRFKAAQDEVFAKTSAFMSAQAEERQANLAKKQALCERAEALADSTDWVKTASALQQLQAEWKAVGAVSRGHEKAVWERFRGACDRFFTRRQDDLKHRKEDWAANFARKEALCVRAEELSTSTEWDTAASELRKLQTEWKAIGPVKRSKSEAIWQRFRTACDAFFERYKNRHSIELQSKAAPRQAVLERLEALVPAAGAAAADAPADLYAVVQQARADWQGAPELPKNLQQEMALRYHQALGQLVAAWPGAFAGTDLDPEATRARMEKLVARVETLLAAKPAEPALSPAERLAQQWRTRLAANTMSGAAKSGERDDASTRAGEQEVRAAQAQWMRLGPVPPDVAGPLNERFQRACRRFFDQRRHG